jgi:hypothetical protein
VGDSAQLLAETSKLLQGVVARFKLGDVFVTGEREIKISPPNKQAVHILHQN